MKTHDGSAEPAQREPAAARHAEASTPDARNTAGSRPDGAQAAIDASPRMLAQRRAVDAGFGAVAQRQADEPGNGRSAPAANETGMPDLLKAGIEALSGMDLSDVRVHRNSGRPAQLNALAYAQGSEIHLGPGEDRQLPHEAWHVVQQRQGRVQATAQVGGVAVNDEAGLEREADVMGGRAVLQGTGMDLGVVPSSGGAGPGLPAPVAQRRIAYVGAGLGPRPAHADVKPRVRAAFLRIQEHLAEPDRLAFQAAFGKDRNDLSLGHRLIELIHDDTEHGEFDIDNDQHMVALFHEVMGLQRHSLDAYKFSKALAKEFASKGRAALCDEPVEEEEHQRLLKAVGGAFNEMWVRDEVLALGLRPSGASEAETNLKGQPVNLEDTAQLKQLYRALLHKLRGLPAQEDRGASRRWDERIWDTVYLGSGAAVAYHMVANRFGGDRLQTLVLGKQQPWTPGSSGDRAFQSVNHPLGWISPKRGQVQDSKGFADTGEFSAEVAEVIKAHSVLQVDTDIKTGGVRKSTLGPYYEIETGRGLYRARHVVSALGIGKHKPPIDNQEEFEARGARGDNARVLDMDEFHRQLREETSPLNVVRRQRGSAFRMVLAGPNAGVDVAYSATRAGIDVTWFAASKPAWVKGFANYKIVTDRLTIVLAYFGDYKAVRESDKVVGVEVTAGTNRYSDKVAELLIRNRVRAVLKASEAPKTLFDYFVYAVGPDESASGALAPELKAELEKPQADIPDSDRRFTQPGFQPTPGEEARATEEKQEAWKRLQLTGGSVRDKLLAGLVHWYAKTHAEKAPDLAALAIEKIVAVLQGVGGLTELKPVPTATTLNLRLADADGTSLEVIGAQAPRIRGKDASMKASVDSLGPTIVGSDQLTPARSRAEASAGVKPAYLGKKEGGIDVATDDQVVIASYIALGYDLPGLLADYMTRRIIEDRVGEEDKDALGGYKPETGLRPDDEDPESFGRAFQAKWLQLLEALEEVTRRE